MLSASAKRNRNNKAERTCHLAIRYLPRTGTRELLLRGAGARGWLYLPGAGVGAKNCLPELPSPAGIARLQLSSHQPRAGGIEPEMSGGQSPVAADRFFFPPMRQRATREYLTGPKLIYVCGHEFTWCVFCGDK